MMGRGRSKAREKDEKPLALGLGAKGFHSKTIL
jgi:hypothetical protein